MKLRARLSLFTGLIILSLVGGSAFPRSSSSGKCSWHEVRSNQETTLKSFAQVCDESLVLQDPVIVANYVDSLKKSLPGLAYATFANQECNASLGDTPKFQRNLSLFFPCGGARPPPPNWFGQPGGGRDSGSVHCPIGMGLSYGMARVGFYQAVCPWRPLRTKSGPRSADRSVGGGVSLVFAVLATLVMSAQITRPLHLLAEGAKAIGDGNLDTQIHVGREDELGFLAHEFNIMAIKLKELDQLKDEFVSSVSHELRSPLAAISGYVELMTRKPLEQIPVEKRTKAFNIILDSTNRLTQFINDILDLAKLKAGRVDVRKTAFSMSPRRWTKP
jgi:HAMP domain-containing protein